MKHFIFARSRRRMLPFSPGGGTDVYARLLARGMAEALGQPMVAESDAGGAGTVMSGQIQLYFDTPMPGMTYVKAGKLRLLAVLDDQRSSLAPDVPTLTELGVPVVAHSRFSLLAPAGTPAAVIDKLNRAALAAMAAGPLRDRQVADGAVPSPATPAQLAAMLKADYELWGAVIHKVGIHLD